MSSTGLAKSMATAEAPTISKAQSNAQSKVKKSDMSMKKGAPPLRATVRRTWAALYLSW